MVKTSPGYIDLSTFSRREVVVETFRAYGENSRNKIRVRPIASEGFDPEIRVQCALKMRADHPVGTIFRLSLTVRDAGGGDTLFAPENAPYTVVEQEEVELQSEVKKHAKSSSDTNTLTKRAHWFLSHPVFLKRKPQGNKKPRKAGRSANSFQRSPKVVAWIRLNADGRCELCEKKAPFKDKWDEPFLEVHHVLPLAEGGPDTIDNATAVCPNCHRALHMSIKPFDLTQRLYENIDRLREY